MLCYSQVASLEESDRVWKLCACPQTSASSAS